MSRLGWIRRALRETADSCLARSPVPREIRRIGYACRRYGAPWLRVAKAHRYTGSGRSCIENMASGRRTSNVYRAGRASSAHARCDSVKPIMETNLHRRDTPTTPRAAHGFRWALDWSLLRRLRRRRRRRLPWPRHSCRHRRPTGELRPPRLRHLLATEAGRRAT